MTKEMFCFVFISFLLFILLSISFQKAFILNSSQGVKPTNNQTDTA